MANGMIGNHPSHNYQVVELIDTTGKELGIADSGKIFMVDHSSALTINLPKMSTGIAGWQCKFVTRTSGADGHIMAWNLTSAGGTGDSGVTNDGDTVVLKEIATTDAGAATATSQDGVILKDGATAGDCIEIFTDGSLWYATSIVADAAHSDDIDG